MRVILDPKNPVQVSLPLPRGLARWRPWLDVAQVAILFLSLIIVAVSTYFAYKKAADANTH